MLNQLLTFHDFSGCDCLSVLKRVGLTCKTRDQPRCHG